MLSRAKESVPNLPVSHREWIMYDTNTTLILDRKSDKHSDGWQVAFDKIICSIKWVNPNTGVFCIESLKVINGYLILTVVLAERAANPLSALVMLSVEETRLDEALDLVGDGAWVDSALHVLDAFLRLFTFDSQGRVECLQVDFERLLDSEISDSDGVVHSLLLRLMLSRLLYLPDDLAALFRKVDADGEEFGYIDILVALRISSLCSCPIVVCTTQIAHCKWNLLF